MIPREAGGRDEHWETLFRALEDFKEKHGHCRVPHEWVESPGLYDWVLRQRRQGSSRKLSRNRKRRLDELGFIWSAHDLRWNEMYLELRRYQSIHGHCRAHADRNVNPALAAWVDRQRTLRKSTKLSAERIRLLDQIGFDWHPWDAQWERRYRELADYCRQHGNPHVPDRWKGNPGLAKWVSHQRAAAIRGTLPEERRRLLDSLGFRWTARS